MELIKLGFNQSEYKQCHFLKDGIICGVYADDTFFFAKDNNVINTHISQLKKLVFDLTEEGDVTAFLGVKVKKNENGVITMTQTGLVNNILKVENTRQDSHHKSTFTLK